MKTLYILRHSKSSRDEADIKDADRPLKTKGINDAYHKGHFLNARKVSIDLLMTSPALRALNTAIIVAETIGYPHEKIAIKTDLYDQGMKKMVNLIGNVKSDVNSLMIVGHNPYLTELSNYLTEDAIENIPTSGLVCIEFETNDWKKPGKGKIKYAEFSKSVAV